MFELVRLTDENAQRITEIGEAPRDLRESAPNVALIVTQSWCSDWHFMDAWLHRVERNIDMTMKVYYFEYDKSPLRQDFMSFKESIWKNELIPYVRYYKDGNYIGDSNALSHNSFMGRFHEVRSSVGNE